MADLIIDLDNPLAVDAETVFSKTILCWEDFPAKDLALKGQAPTVVNPTIGTAQRDTCGDGIGIYMLTKPRMAWKSFPVYYHIDPTLCNHKDKTQVTAAIKAGFDSYNAVLRRNAFQQTGDRALAKIKVFWATHDGYLGQLAICNYNYYPLKNELISATIKFDQNDSWFVNPALQCGYTASPFDIQNCAGHEIGHGVGLSHCFNDPLSTMFPTLKRGETLRRSLDAGTIKAVKSLYNIV